MGFLLFFLLFFLLVPFLLALFVALGCLLFVKPQGLRPAWWDWGMDEPRAVAETVAKAEPAPLPPAVQVEKMAAEAPQQPSQQAPRVAAPERVKKPAGPRW